MALPPHGLGAHHRNRPVLAAKSSSSSTAAANSARLHVIGVAAERLVSPRAVRRIRARLSQSAERREVTILDAFLRQTRVERLAAEMRDGAAIAESSARRRGRRCRWREAARRNSSALRVEWPIVQIRAVRGIDQVSLQPACRERARAPRSGRSPAAARAPEPACRFSARGRSRRRRAAGRDSRTCLAESSAQTAGRTENGTSNSASPDSSACDERAAARTMRDSASRASDRTPVRRSPASTPLHPESAAQARRQSPSIARPPASDVPKRSNNRCTSVPVRLRLLVSI